MPPAHTRPRPAPQDQPLRSLAYHDVGHISAGPSYPGRTLAAVTSPARARRFAAETALARTRRARRMTRELAEL